MSETQNDIRFTNHATIYLEVGTVKLAQGNRSVLTTSAAQAVGTPPDAEAVAELKQQIRQLQQEVEQLKKNGVAASQETAKAPTRQPVANKNSFKVPTERVYQVLREATREHLVKVKDVWEDLLQMLSVSQRAILKATEPVAGSPKSMVLAFDYEIFCGRAAGDSEIQLAIQNNLSRLIDYSPEIVCITRESWPSLRKTFIQQTKGQPTTSEAETTELEAATDAVQVPEDEQIESESANAQGIVDEAVTMFGTEFVEVVND